jgi:hypothetical protein
VAHFCNPNYKGRLPFKTRSGKEFTDLISTSGWAQWHVPVIPAMQGSRNKRVTVQVVLSIKQDPISKSTDRKMGWWSGLSGRAPES